MQPPGRLPLWNVLLALWCIRTLRWHGLLGPIYTHRLGLSVNALHAHSVRGAARIRSLRRLSMDGWLSVAEHRRCKIYVCVSSMLCLTGVALTGCIVRHLSPWKRVTQNPVKVVAS